MENNNGPFKKYFSKFDSDYKIDAAQICEFFEPEQTIEKHLYINCLIRPSALNQDNEINPHSFLIKSPLSSKMIIMGKSEFVKKFEIFYDYSNYENKDLGPIGALGPDDKVLGSINPPDFNIKDKG
jgi:hypothetical protein